MTSLFETKQGRRIITYVGSMVAASIAFPTAFFDLPPEQSNVPLALATTVLVLAVAAQVLPRGKN